MQLDLYLVKNKAKAAMNWMSHARGPVILDSVSESHPFYGIDIRSLSDEHLATSAARELIPGQRNLWTRFDLKESLHSQLSQLLSSNQQRISRTLLHYRRIQNLVFDESRFDLNTRDEILEITVLAFIHLVGAFDSLAVFNGMLAGLDRPREMSWERKEFRRDLRREAPHVMALLEKNSSGGKTLQAIKGLRNTIHRYMPNHSIGQPWRDGSSGEVKLIFERGTHPEIFETFDSAGWTKLAGIDHAGPSLILARPETLLLVAINRAIPLINQILQATPAEKIGEPRFSADDEIGFYPEQVREYALSYIGLRHLRSS